MMIAINENGSLIWLTIWAQLQRSVPFNTHFIQREEALWGITVNIIDIYDMHRHLAGGIAVAQPRYIAVSDPRVLSIIIVDIHGDIKEWQIRALGRLRGRRARRGCR
jgi:hypothetical protein